MSEPFPSGRKVWIAGASSGIGRALAELLAAKGADVAVSARSGDKLDSLAAGHASVTAFPLDVSDSAAVKRSITAIEADGRPIDTAILCAAIWHMMDAVAFDGEKVREAFRVNVGGVVNALDALLPGMLARGAGRIVIVASVAGYRGLPKSAAYGPTKAALINLAESLHAELKPHGVTVTLVDPGFVDTPMTKGNPFPMPNMVSVERAADEILAGLQKGSFEIGFPLRFLLAMKLLRILPYAVYFWVVRTFMLGSGQKSQADQAGRIL